MSARLEAANRKHFGNGEQMPKPKAKRGHLLYVYVGAELEGALKLRARQERKFVSQIVRGILWEGLK